MKDWRSQAHVKWICKYHVVILPKYRSRNQRVGKKTREIDPPKPYAKALLRKLHRGLQAAGVFHGCAHGGIRGRSIFTSAAVHVGKPYVWTRDAKDCFPSISRDALFSELKALGFERDVARLLAKLLTVRGRIPRGSPASTDAVNLFFFRLDQKIASAAGRLDAAYGRVIDDVIVSCPEKSCGDNLIREVEKEVEDRGIRINEKKRRAIGLQDRSAPQLVHNLRVDVKKGVRICKEHRSAALQIAKDYVDACRRLTATSLPAVAHKRRRLLGFINFLAQADSSPIRHLRDELAVGDRHVKRRLTSNRLHPYRGRWWVQSRKRDEPARLAAQWRDRLKGTVASKSA